MTIDQKNEWRLRFKILATAQVYLVVIIGSVLAYLGKSGEFGTIAIASMTFAGAVFSADYFSAPKNNEDKVNE